LRSIHKGVQKARPSTEINIASKLIFNRLSKNFPKLKTLIYSSTPIMVKLK